VWRLTAGSERTRDHDRFSQKTSRSVPVVATNAGMVVLNGAILAAKLRYK
jgi:hypothetical protein